MINSKILEFLKTKDGYISGEEMSVQLKITRQGLWKHIQELRDAGYDIIAVPHLGYQLLSSPDRLLPEEISSGLNTKFIGRKIAYFETLPSTMDEAVKLALADCPEGAVVLAETQTKGRGRLGRSWISPRHKGIYFSLILRPRISPQNVAVLTLLCAVSICQAIKDLLGFEPRIKWPNDIFLGNKKLGGILTQLGAETDEIHFIAIGIGLNVNNDLNSLPEHATSLAEQKKSHYDRVLILQEIFSYLERNYLDFQKHGSAHVIDKWRQYNLTIGRRVRVTCQDRHLEGEAIDIDSDGGLLVRSDSGLVQKIMAGDVVHCR